MSQPTEIIARRQPAHFITGDTSYLNFLDEDQDLLCYSFSTWLLHRQTNEVQHIDLVINSDRYAPCVDAVRHFFSREDWLIMAEFTEIEAVQDLSQPYPELAAA
jgi:hypothetical protein